MHWSNNKLKGAYGKHVAHFSIELFVASKKGKEGCRKERPKPVGTHSWLHRNRPKFFVFRHCSCKEVGLPVLLSSQPHLFASALFEHVSGEVQCWSHCLMFFEPFNSKNLWSVDSSPSFCNQYHHSLLADPLAGCRSSSWPRWVQRIYVIEFINHAVKLPGFSTFLSYQWQQYCLWGSFSNSKQTIPSIITTWQQSQLASKGGERGAEPGELWKWVDTEDLQSFGELGILWLSGWKRPVSTSSNSWVTFDNEFSYFNPMEPWDRKFKDETLSFLKNRLMESKIIFLLATTFNVSRAWNSMVGTSLVTRGYQSILPQLFSGFRLIIWVDWQQDQVGSTKERTDFSGVCPRKRGKLPALGTPENMTS